MAPGLRRSRLPALAAGELVQGHLRAELERAPAGDVRLISLCAGQGRDVIGVLTGHPRRDDVRARLVELDERNVALARQAAQAAGLHGVEVLQADAGITDACAGAVPAQVVVACGIFGNITGSDIQATVAALPSLRAPGALVLWTRHRERTGWRASVQRLDRRIPREHVNAPPEVPVLTGQRVGTRAVATLKASDGSGIVGRSNGWYVLAL
jgi:hypothetical protein